MEEDEELLIKLRLNDHSAFERIYRKYASEIFRYIADRIYGRDNCERILTSTFVMIWQHRRKLANLREDIYEAMRFNIFKHILHSPDKDKYYEHFRKYIDDEKRMSE